MKLDFTPAAISDLCSISDYTLQACGPQQEEIYLTALWARFDEILASPHRWRFRPDLFPSCQIASHLRHVILFRIQGDILQIVRILHVSMDLPRHIPKDLDA
jgi:toxin ParE1/3/4